MDNPTKELRKLMQITYTEGLNIYALVQRVQNETAYPLSAEVVEAVCRQYLKYKHGIRSAWAWSNKVFRLIRDNAFVNSKVGEIKEEKKINAELLEKLFGGTKFGTFTSR